MVADVDASGAFHENEGIGDAGEFVEHARHVAGGHQCGDA